MSARSPAGMTRVLQSPGRQVGDTPPGWASPKRAKSRPKTCPCSICQQVMSAHDDSQHDRDGLIRRCTRHVPGVRTQAHATDAAVPRSGWGTLRDTS